MVVDGDDIEDNALGQATEQQIMILNHHQILHILVKKRRQRHTEVVDLYRSSLPHGYCPVYQCLTQHCVPF